MKRSALVLVFTFLFAWQNFSQACSVTASPPGWPYGIGHNFDWLTIAPTMKGAFGFTPSSLEKKSLPVLGQPSIEWKSRYASYTYSIIASEFPVSGVNEAGLFIATQAHNGGVYPDIHGPKDTLSTLQWVQYNLDTAATIEEVIASDAHVQAYDAAFRVHFFVCDKSRRCAVMEYIDGALAAYSGDTLKYPMMTNSHYTLSQAAAENCSALGCMNADISLARFANLAYMYEHGGTQTSLALLWRTMEYIRQPFPDATAGGTSTRHHLLYDFENGRMSVRFPGSTREAFVNLDFANSRCDQRASAIRILEPAESGNIEATLAAVSLEVNTELGRNSGVSEASWMPRASYALDPTNVRCAP